MDEIETRLRETSEKFIKAYETWSKSKKNAESRSLLQETLHELRKVSARIEIEMASSERDEMTQRQIPIPPHRSSRQRSEGGLPDFITEGGNGDDDSFGNTAEGSEGGQPQPRPQRGPNRMQNRRPVRPRPSENGNE